MGSVASASPLSVNELPPRAPGIAVVWVRSMFCVISERDAVRNWELTWAPAEPSGSVAIQTLIILAKNSPQRSAGDLTPLALLLHSTDCRRLRADFITLLNMVTDSWKCSGFSA